MKIEKIPEGYLLARKGGNGCELWRKFNGAESLACDAIDELIAERDDLRAKLERVEKQRDGLIGTMRVLAARPAVDEGRSNWEAIVWESIGFAEEAIARATGEQP